MGEVEVKETRREKVLKVLSELTMEDVANAIWILELFTRYAAKARATLERAYRIFGTRQAVGRMSLMDMIAQQVIARQAGKLGLPTSQGGEEDEGLEDVEIPPEVMETIKKARKVRSELMA